MLKNALFPGNNLLSKIKPVYREALTLLKAILVGSFNQIVMNAMKPRTYSQQRGGPKNGDSPKFKHGTFKFYLLL